MLPKDFLPAIQQLAKISHLNVSPLLVAPNLTYRVMLLTQMLE